ncbi:MAG: hypothetical protein K2P85_09895 [Flavobacteriaceae bacterium]|nr:hypothetical protein [Flavobacteriaceae bacterium]
MSHEKKQQVLEFLQGKEGTPNYEQFNKAFEFYKLHPAKSRSSEINYNRKGFTDQGLKNLLYDLQKVYCISDIEILETGSAKEVIALKPSFQKFINIFNDLEEVKKINALVLLKFASEFGEEIILATPVLTDYFENDYETLRNLIAQNDLLLENEVQLEELILHFEKEIEPVLYPKELELILDENKQVVQLVPVDTIEDKKAFIDSLVIPDFAFLDQVPGEEIEQITSEESVSLREEFPFLSDPNCPELLFVVVGKRISAWKQYQLLHAKLQQINDGKLEVSEEEKRSITLNCEKAYNENQQLWLELKHFGATGEILGSHPIFRESVAKREVDGMTNEELFKFKNSTATYLSRKRKELLKNAKDAVKLEQFNKEIADREYMLSLVNAKIGVANAGTQAK